MAQAKVVFRSLADLAQLLDELPVEEEPTAASAPAPVDVLTTTLDIIADQDAAMPAVDLPTLLAELQAASAALATATARDQEARTVALGQLAAYDTLVGRQQEAEEALAQAQQVRRDADTLATAAFTEEAGVAAGAVAQTAAQVETHASRLLAQRQEETERLLAQPVLQRLLEERRQEATRQDAAAAEAERTQRLQDSLATVHAVLAAGRFQEAEAMLGPLAKDNPDSADVTSFQHIIRQRAQAVKISAADEALRAARRAYRQTPAEAVARLEGLDLQGLPQDLLHQISGVWAAACARLCQARGVTAPLLRYLPAPAHGVVVAREQEGCYRVVSALGARDWAPGSPVPEAFLRQARPLRAAGH
jgi:hypothetical protein